MPPEAHFDETVIGLRCATSSLWGILARPSGGRAESDIAVLIVVGGPQYRVGSHRQFVQLARGLAGRGFPVLRFDCRGMGDSEGERLGFERIAPDLQAAIDALCRECPRARGVVLWGLCDAASALMMFGAADPRACGIVAANPWVRSEASLAAAHVRHYYGARLLQADFWLRVSKGRLDWRASWKSLVHDLKLTLEHHRAHRATGALEPFQTAMARGLSRFHGQTLLILSGQDLTAREFLEYTAKDEAWHGLLDAPRVRRLDLAEADHTFSRRAWLDRVEAETASWLLGMDTALRAEAPPEREQSRQAIKEDA